MVFRASRSNEVYQEHKLPFKMALAALFGRKIRVWSTHLFTNPTTIVHTSTIMEAIPFGVDQSDLGYDKRSKQKPKKKNETN